MGINDEQEKITYAKRTILTTDSVAHYQAAYDHLESLGQEEFDIWLQAHARYGKLDGLSWDDNAQTRSDMTPQSRKYTDEQLAMICHEANWAMQVIQDDLKPSEHWFGLDEETRESVISGVRRARTGVTPQTLHELWCRFKMEHDWVYGLKKDERAKTHPCLVPYDELPESQKEKNILFLAIVRALDVITE